MQCGRRWFIIHAELLKSVFSCTVYIEWDRSHRQMPRMTVFWALGLRASEFWSLIKWSLVGLTTIFSFLHSYYSCEDIKNIPKNCFHKVQNYCSQTVIMNSSSLGRSCACGRGSGGEGHMSWNTYFIHLSIFVICKETSIILFLNYNEYHFLGVGKWK